MSEDNRRIARQVLEELFEKGNLDAADELIHPDFVNHEAPPDSPQGPAGLKEAVGWLRGLGGPMRAEIEDEICEADKVVARVTMHARHVGEFLGRAPTGKEFAVEHIHIWRLEGDRVIE